MNKIKFKIVIAFFCIGLFGACKTNTFNIEGKVNTTENNEYVMLFTFDKKGEVLSVDTTKIVNGLFTFKGDEYTSTYSILTIGNYPNTVISTEVILDKGTINVVMDTMSCTVKGTFLNDLQQSYTDSCKFYSSLMVGLIEECNATKNYSKAYEARDKFYQYKRNFKIANASNLLGKRAFMRDLYDYTDKYFEEIYALADDEIKSDSAVLFTLKDRANEKNKQKKLQQWIGKEFTDFTLTTINGESKKISDYFGNSDYIFIDFWASWCNPCLEDIPHLKELYLKYKDKGFTIISISFDSNTTKWRDCLKKIEIPWAQLITTEGSSSEIGKKYEITGIPYGILLDKNKKILHVGIRGIHLEQILPQIIN